MRRTNDGTPSPRSTPHRRLAHLSDDVCLQTCALRKEQNTQERCVVFEKHLRMVHHVQKATAGKYAVTSTVKVAYNAIFGSAQL